MTALALALVACCAMVCGTRLALHVINARVAEAANSDTAQKALDKADALVDSLRVHRQDHDAISSELKALRAEVESLRAHGAFRSM